MNVAASLILVAFFGCYGLAYLLGGWDEERTRRSHRVLLRGTSGVLVVAAWWFWAKEVQGSPLDRYAFWIALGMSLSCLGDLVTGGILPTRKPYITAMGLFGIGHIAYLVAIGAASTALQAHIMPGPLLLGLAGGVFCWATLVRRPGVRSLMNRLALGYSLLLGAMVGGALSLVWQRPALWPLAVGAVLFGASDLLLGRRELRKLRWFLMYDVIWALYIFGQLLIVWSVRAAS